MNTALYILMTEITTTVKLRPDNRISIPKDTIEAGNMKAGEFFQITIKQISQSGSGE